MFCLFSKHEYPPDSPFNEWKFSVFPFLRIRILIMKLIISYGIFSFIQSFGFSLSVRCKWEKWMLNVVGNLFEIVALQKQDMGSEWVLPVQLTDDNSIFIHYIKYINWRDFRGISGSENNIVLIKWFLQYGISLTTSQIKYILISSN